LYLPAYCFFFSSRRRHTRFSRDWSSDVCSSDLTRVASRPVTDGPRIPSAAVTGRDATLVGALLDHRYLVTGVLARGGMSTVYREIGRATCRVRVKISEVGGG